ncbi:hypothetical protein D3C87_2043900 [compost metagenome]
MDAGAFLISCSKPAAVTTTVSIWTTPIVSSLAPAADCAWALPAAAIANTSGNKRNDGKWLGRAPPEPLMLF